jgi:hypothetical protein
MHFVVSLPEAGNVDEMRQMLQTNPEHERELLFGERDGVAQGRYSVWAYATWLCHFEAHCDEARRVVRWLLTQGHAPDLWSAIALDDAAGLQRLLHDDPRLARYFGAPRPDLPPGRYASCESPSDAQHRAP